MISFIFVLPFNFVNIFIIPASRYRFTTMDIGIVKIAEDKDFEKLKQLYDDNNNWKLDYNKPDLSVWTKSVPGISFRMVKVSLLLINKSYCA